MVLKLSEEIVGGTGLAPIEGLLVDGLIIAGTVFAITWCARKSLENLGLAKAKH